MEDPAASIVISEPERRLAGRIRSLVGEGIDDPLKLELYASVWYHAPARELSDGDRKSIINTMLYTKPHFGERQVRTALSKIEKFRKGEGGD